MNDGAAAQSRSGGAPPSRSRTGAADEAQAEQGIADGVAAADVLLTELATERCAHARAERELKDKLAAAREAGKAVLASLRGQTVAAAEAPRGRGWLAPMLRRVGSRTVGQLQRFGGKPSVITLADRAQSTGQWQRAARLYRTALDRNPLNPPIWVQRPPLTRDLEMLLGGERGVSTSTFSCLCLAAKSAIACWITFRLASPVAAAAAVSSSTVSCGRRKLTSRSARFAGDVQPVGFRFAIPY
jgi:hypothetical protein